MRSTWWWLAWCLVLAPQVAAPNPPPPSWCDSNPHRCHWLTASQLARYTGLAKRLKQALPSLRETPSKAAFSTTQDGYGNTAADAFPSELTAQADYDSDAGSAAVSLTALPIAAGCPLERQLTIGQPSIRATSPPVRGAGCAAEFSLPDAGTAPWTLIQAVYGELGDPTAAGGSPRYEPQALPPGPVRLRSIAVQISGAPELVKRLWAALDEKRLTVDLNQTASR